MRCFESELINSHLTESQLRVIILVNRRAMPSYSLGPLGIETNKAHNKTL